MDSLLSRIRRGELWQSPGGIHPTTHKHKTNSLPIHSLPLPEKLVLPIKQHIGAEGQLLVSAGEQVLKGQALTRPNANWSVPVHAPTSGRIVDITPMPSAHPSAIPELSIIIEPDGQETWCELVPHPNYQQLSAERLVDIIHYAGISGMGGAGFPTYVKTASKQPIDILIVNGAECEPYISADDVLMQAHSEEIVRGIHIIQHLLGPELTIIGIEDDKPKAIEAMTQACADYDNIIVRAIETKYPSGGEKQLIQILTSKEVPAGGIPADIGVLVQNVGTLYAIQQAVELGKPLIERVVTLAGETLEQQGNVWALLGTEIKHLLAFQGFNPEPMQRVIMGGPMMGFTLPSVRIPVVKTTNCILAPSNQEMPAPGDERACIRCSACADACPASLLPQQLQWFAKTKEYQKLEEHKLFDCIECGACAYVCPSEIPLVQYYRVAKAEIREQQIEQVKAERARERFEARKARLEREQEERRNRHKRPSRSAAKSSESKEKVAEALARVKAKKTEPGDNKAKVAEAIARAKAKKAQGEAPEPDNSEVAQARAQRKEQARAYKAQKQQPEQAPSATTDDKKAAVAAAVARAKAKKAQQGEQSDSQPTAAEDKKAAVAAAIARAKAKKAAKADASAQQPDEAAENVESETEAPSAEDNKKAAVAAAIARAKAKKAAKADASAQQPDGAADSAESETEAPSPEDNKKAAVAAAIARTKAKKAANADASAQQPDGAADSTESETEASSAEDNKKAAVAAAIARAKAKKAAKAEASAQHPDAATEGSSDETEAPSPEEKKKAAVAAAIARAKAKKAAREADKNDDEESS
ncbi:electron transport complex subunit RsxC [Pseudoalteromonas sp. Cnat2-41]|uniref:electron transport complex subunit RsxC n=1 Tax=unclassified Pseudoalteromonas TaxID=194690 RepID=UPI001EF840D6|nr:electron transport complex subunit RsxC [Pseudoalteromonas sp. CNAT2-18]MCF2863919.1 electron transport complex subunit RsxC [Pseudoalteromonas sp. CNAT2-18]MCG7558586.1 electron transport complex subunit RsxC [Pseudoalteromonas sp. CNAT2-18.1]